jgi:hypothetical protein
MSLTYSSRNHIISGSFLRADCIDDANVSQPSQLDLDSFIGVVDGKLTWGAQGWSRQARNVSISRGILSAEVRHGDKWVASTINLDEHVRNSNGALEVYELEGLKAPVVKGFDVTGAQG